MSKVSLISLFSTNGICFLIAIAPVDAQTLRYTWSGFVEPGTDGNPFGFDGDGIFETRTDGTPYNLDVFVESNTPDIGLGLSQPNFALFNASSVSLSFDGNLATLVDTKIRFLNDFNLLYDGIVIEGQLTFNGFTRGIFGAGVHIPPSSFDLLPSPDADSPPLFQTTMSNFNSDLFSTDYIILSSDAPVSVTVIPEPTTLSLVLAALCLAFRRHH